MRKLFAEDLELWGTLLPGVLAVPLIVVLGFPAAVVATALIWVTFRSVALISATDAETRFDPAEASARTLARLSRVTPEGRPFSLAEALMKASEANPVADPSAEDEVEVHPLAEAS